MFDEIKSELINGSNYILEIGIKVLRYKVKILIMIHFKVVGVIKHGAPQGSILFYLFLYRIKIIYQRLLTEN
jgi:hypothetical protein